MDRNEEESLAPLAAALHALHRRPDDDGKWVKPIVHLLETSRKASLDAIWRRLGLARDLGRLAGLPDVDTAGLTLGLFFDGISSGSRSTHRKPPREWLEYLRQNSGWLAPAVRIGQIVHGREQPESLAEAVAGVVANYDRMTHLEQVRPMNALIALREQEMTGAEDQIVELLWTEAGQAICDRHFRAQERPYPMEANQIREALILLKAKSRPSAQAQSTPSGQSPPDGVPLALELGDVSAAAAAKLDNFERRKAQLHHLGANEPPNLISIGEHRKSPRDAISTNQRQEGLGGRGGQMNANTYPRSHAGQIAVEDQIEQLRACLTQINRLSGDALGLLGSLDPSVRRNARVAAELNAMMQRVEDDSLQSNEVA